MAEPPFNSVRPRGLDTVSPQVLGSDIEYPLQSNTLSAKSVLGGRVALTPHNVLTIYLLDIWVLVPSVWRLIHDKCFAEIKALVMKAPILKPINPEMDDPIWVVCDTSVLGVGAFYG